MNDTLNQSPVYRGNSFNMADRKAAFNLPETHSDSSSTDNFHLGDTKRVNSGSVAKDANDGAKEEKPGVLDLVKNFGETTSMHGLPHALGDGPVWRRLFWSALVIGFAVWAIYNVTEIVKDFRSRPVLTSVTSEFQSKMAFPAVTFCNLNRVRKSKASQSLLEDVEANLVVSHEKCSESKLNHVWQRIKRKRVIESYLKIEHYYF